tara:strand:+ start:147 stop:758 length:612 start_codon:yes stop_codon:yes gene_type:complete
MQYKYKEAFHKDVRKLPYNLENPIDNILVDIADAIDPVFLKLGFTPNGITTLSLITGILLNYFYWRNSYGIAAIMAILSYFFDCMDGNFARKYNMVTDFGDMYDHVKDISVILVLFVLFLRKDVGLQFKIMVILLLVLLVIAAIYHLACQERFIKKHKKLVLSKYLNNLSQDCSDEMMQYTRYFGSGSFYAVLVGSILLHPYF